MFTLDVANSGRRNPQTGRLNTRRLSVELLEDRRLLAIVTVDTNLDNVDPLDGLTSLREAIAETNALSGPDTILFAATLSGQTITLGGNSTTGVWGRGGGFFTDTITTLSHSMVSGNSMAGENGRGGGFYADFFTTLYESAGNWTTGERTKVAAIAWMSSWSNPLSLLHATHCVEFLLAIPS